MKTKRVPMRMCMACKERKPKKELIRIVRESDTAVSFDPTGKKAGRGAYICRTSECFQRAVKAKAIERALEVGIDADGYERLKEEFAGIEG